MSWGKTSTWFGGYGNKEERISPIQTDTSKNARRYGSTSARTIVEPKKQTWLSSLLDTTGVVRSDLYKGGEEAPQSGGGSENYAAPVVNEVSVAKGANGEPIMVNGKPYIDRFTGGGTVTKPESETPPLTETSPAVETPVAETPVAETPVTETPEANQNLDLLKYIEDMKANTAGYNDALGNAKDKYDEIKSTLNEQYNGAVGALNSKYEKLAAMLGSERSVAEQRAAINNAKLLKYLPEQLKSMGLYGVGTSQGAYLKAANMYNNQLSEAQRNYIKQILEAESSRDSGIAAAASSKNSALASALSNYSNIVANLDAQERDRIAGLDNAKLAIMNQMASDESTDKANNNAALWNYIMNEFDTGGYATADEVQNAMNNLPEEVKGLYGGLLNHVADKYVNDLGVIEGAKEKAENVTEVTEIKGDTNGVNATFKVVVNGQKYKITTGEAEPKDSDVYEAAKSFNDNTVFRYGNDLYIKVNGRVMQVLDENKYDALDLALGGSK